MSAAYSEYWEGRKVKSWVDHRQRTRGAHCRRCDCWDYRPARYDPRAALHGKPAWTPCRSILNGYWSNETEPGVAKRHEPEGLQEREQRWVHLPQCLRADSIVSIQPRAILRSGTCTVQTLQGPACITHLATCSRYWTTGTLALPNISFTTIGTKWSMHLTRL